MEKNLSGLRKHLADMALKGENMHNPEKVKGVFEQHNFGLLYHLVVERFHTLVGAVTFFLTRINPRSCRKKPKNKARNAPIILLLTHFTPRCPGA